MNWLIVLLICMLNMLSGNDFCKIKKSIFLENDFWNFDQEQLKTDKGYLGRVDIDLERNINYTSGFNCNTKICYSLKSTKLGYIIPKHWLLKDEDVYSFIKSLKLDKFLLKFSFYFTDKLIDRNLRCFEEYEGEVQKHVNYKVPKKITVNSISLRNDGIDIRMKHIKNMFKIFIWPKLLKFNEYIKCLDQNKKEPSKIEDDADFNLHYFKNYSECLANLKTFINDLRYFNLLEDDFSDLSTVDMSVNKTTTLNVSQFEESLYEKVYNSLEKLNHRVTYENWEPLLDRCCDYFKIEMLKSNIFFPIGENFNIDFYIKQLSNIILKLIKDGQKEYEIVDPEIDGFIFYGKNCPLNFYLEKLQTMVVQNLCESEFVHKHFSKLLGKKVETLYNYIEVEKMVCDYYNIFDYISNLYYKFIDKKSCISCSQVSPIFIDNYNIRIVVGIEIKFNTLDEFGKIKGFDNKGEEIIIKENYDYFIDEFDSFCFPSEVIKMKSIYEFEIISFDEKKYMKFKVDDYLSI